MKRNCLICALLFAGSMSCQNSRIPDAGRQYMFRVQVDAGAQCWKDKLIEMEIDFNAKLDEIFRGGKPMQRSSIRMFEVDADGRLIEEVTHQYDDRTLLWIMKGHTSANSRRFYQVHFNTADRPVPAFESEPLVTMGEAPGRWLFQTPGGYYVFERDGGAFEVFSPIPCEDNEPGKDWMRDDYNRYNGILNVGDPDTHAIFHPNEDEEADDGIGGRAASILVHTGPLRYRIRSINRFGDLGRDYRSNTAYTIYYDILPYGVRATMARGNSHGYACIMEMTPGGDSLETTDYVVRSDGTRNFKDEKWAGDISPEWLYAGDAQDSTRLYFIHVEDDTIKDGLNWYEFMQAVMVGWGRGANPGIHTYPNHFYFGFTRAGDRDEMEAEVRSLTRMPELTAGETEMVSRPSWGGIEISRRGGQLQVELENRIMKCLYAPVPGTPPQTALVEMNLKSSGTDLAGEFLDGAGPDSDSGRGTLSQGTTILYEGEDHGIVRLEWGNGASIQEITLFPDRPWLKIEYLNPSHTIRDLGHPGGTGNSEIVMPGDGKNPANYRGWLIFGDCDPETGEGYGRVAPAAAISGLEPTERGGFEQFPAGAQKGRSHPFSEYLFTVTDGAEEIVALGKEIADRACAEPWYSFDEANRQYGNSLLQIRYGADLAPESSYLTAMTRLLYRPTCYDYAEALDAYGCGYALYYSGGPQNFHRLRADSLVIEVEMAMRMRDCTQVMKRERLFRGLPLLEIEYRELELLWWEDFYTHPQGDERRYSIYGLDRDLTAADHARCRALAEQHCGHNFGDCFLQAAGSTAGESTYRGHLIFGFHDQPDGHGLGFVIPARIGLHNGFKLWSMHNYESFPFYRMEKELPLKRWIYVVENGREEILSMGRALADIAAQGGRVEDHIEELKLR